MRTADTYIPTASWPCAAGVHPSLPRWLPTWLFVWLLMWLLVGAALPSHAQIAPSPPMLDTHANPPPDSLVQTLLAQITRNPGDRNNYIALLRHYDTLPHPNRAWYLNQWAHSPAAYPPAVQQLAANQLHSAGSLGVIVVQNDEDRWPLELALTQQAGLHVALLPATYLAQETPHPLIVARLASVGVTLPDADDSLPTAPRRLVQRCLWIQDAYPDLPLAYSLAWDPVRVPRYKTQRVDLHGSVWRTAYPHEPKPHSWLLWQQLPHTPDYSKRTAADRAELPYLMALYHIASLMEQEGKHAQAEQFHRQASRLLSLTGGVDDPGAPPR